MTSSNGEVHSRGCQGRSNPPDRHRSRRTADASSGLRVINRVARVVVLLGALAVAPGAAQTDTPANTLGETFAGEEQERYLRLLQMADQSRPYPWSIRGFSVEEVQRLAPADSAHPWARRFDFGGESTRAWDVHLHPAAATGIFNSGFPFGGYDGPVWAGRGLTTAVQVGVTARYRQLSLTLAPVAFRAGNADFEPVRSSPSAPRSYLDWRRPGQIDLPQRFGEEPYTGVYPGQSSLQADLGPLTLGASTANQIWGPAAEYPLVLSNNAAGFPHLFAGTSRPLDLWLFRAHGRFVWGRLEQSDFSSTHPDSTLRFMSGIVAVVTPRGIPGLEIGGGRFFHLPWPSDGPSLAQFLKPVETFVKDRLGGPDELAESVVANQIASAFFRWVLPRSGFEVYGELATEDHRHNLRDFVVEPDHDSAYTLGFRRLWKREGARFLVVRGELVNGQPSHLQRGRRQEPFYIHASLRQGHTEGGQILGSPAAYLGAASTFAADLYHGKGRWTARWTRTLRQEEGEYQVTGETFPVAVQQALGMEALFFRGPWELFGAADGIYEFDRHPGNDAVNVRLLVGARLRI